MRDPERQKRIFELVNKIFLFFDGCLTIASIIFSIALSANMCVSLSLQIYEVLYAAQTLQHFLLYKFPTIDINKHHVAYRRIVIAICLVDVGYMFMCVTFWQKTQYHPVYCVLCLQNGFGLWVGLLLVLHQVFLIGWAITLINAYVRRRYYLLALGGYEAEQRIIEQRAQQLRQMMIIEPDTNVYPIGQVPKDKYYKFEDVTEMEENYICSICLNQRIEDDHFVNAGCDHYFHNICLIQWAQVNSNCPQCRKKLKEDDGTIEEVDEKNEEDQVEEETRETSSKGQSNIENTE